MHVHGWMGKKLHVNLNNCEITQFQTQPYANLYLGYVLTLDKNSGSSSVFYVDIGNLT
jgi:hypothetical protein